MIRSLLPLVAITALAAPFGAPQDDPFETRVYNVEIMTRAVRDYPGISFGLYADSIGAGIAVDEGCSRRITGEELAALIRNNVAEDTWSHERAKVEFTEETLTITNLQSVHEKIRHYLAYWQGFFGRTVVMDVAIVAIDPPVLTKIRATGNPDRPLALSSEQARQLVQVAREGKSGELLKTCRLTAQPGQRVNLQDAVRQAYIRDHDVQISAACGVLDPVMDVYSSGTSIDIRSHVEPFLDAVTLEIRAEYVEPQGMGERTVKIAKEVTPLKSDRGGMDGGGMASKPGVALQSVEVKVQLPRSLVHRVRTTITVKDRETALVASPMRLDRNLLFLVTPSVAAPDGKPAPEPVFGGDRLLRVFDVSLLTRGLQDFSGPNMEIVPLQRGGSEGPLTGATFTLDEPVRHMGMEKVIDLIRTKIAPDTWEDKRNSITLGRWGTLFIRQKPEVLRGIGLFLDQLLEARGEMITVEAAAVAFRKGALAEWEREIPALAPGGLFADSEKVQKLLEEAYQGQRVRLVEAAEITSFSHQRVYTARLLEEAYIMDFEPQVSSSESIFDPVIGVVDDGFVLDVRPRFVHGTHQILVDLHAVLARRELKEIPLVSSGLGPIQMPRGTGHDWRSSITCVKGKWTLAGLESRGQGDDAEDVALFVRARPSLLK
jgi:hypothetical protein